MVASDITRAIARIARRLLSASGMRGSEDGYSFVRSVYRAENVMSRGGAVEPNDDSFVEIRKKDVRPGDIVLKALR